ncbi:endonuclease domain-containing protein [Tropicibacter sp. S64]|uniref:endonuclease domain-containing protein n=1 Tax=Tropicibacter sp. S64 TaxID=3415122 RepID=UPI003C79E96C
MPTYRSDAQRMHARSLRQSMTAVQTLLWEQLRGHRFLNLHVRRLAPVGLQVVDFLIVRHSLIIQTGGSADPFDDALRDAELRGRGFTVMRFSEAAIQTDLAPVLERLAREVRAIAAVRFASSHPAAGPRRRSRTHARCPRTQTSA